MHFWYSQRPEQSTGSPRVGIMAEWKPPNGYWEWSMDSLQDQ